VSEAGEKLRKRTNDSRKLAFTGLLLHAVAVLGQSVRQRLALRVLICR
jgi:hypothetical protein